MRKKIKKLGIILLIIILVPLLIPQNLEMPVQGATNADFNPQTFWYYPWRIDSSPLGWQKMFYLNPVKYLE